MLNNTNKRLFNNTIALYIRTFVVLLITLYISRLLLKELGVADFGIYNVVGSVVVLFSFLNNSMIQAIQRFTAFELGKGDMIELQRVFSMSLITQFMSMIIMIVLTETIGLWFLNNQLNIPQERLNAAQFSYQFSILTFCFSMLKVPYEAMIISYEKMSVYAYLGIADAIMKLSIILLLPLFGYDKLILYSLGIAIEALFVFFIYKLYCTKKIKGCKFKPFWDWPLCKKILLFSGWSLCGGITNVATQNGIVLILNIFYGVIVNAAMGIANQVSNALSSFVGSFQTAFRPQLIKAYAQNNNKRVLNLNSKTSKISFLLVFLPAMVLIVNMKMILQLWLTDVPEYTVEFCRLILISIIIDAMTGPYNSTIMATGKIRNYQISISISFILDLIVSYCMIKIGIEPQFILYSRIATRGLLNMFIGWHFLKKQLSFDIKLYLKDVVVPIMIGVIVIIPIPIFLYFILNEWQLFFWSVFTIILIGSLISYYVILNKEERDSLKLLLDKNKANEI